MSFKYAVSVSIVSLHHRFEGQSMLTMMKNCGWLLIACLVSAHALGHEGHKPLPTRGMDVNAETGKMVLTKSARTSGVPQGAGPDPVRVIGID